ncbi:ATP-dependent Clp protease proteolytic subunit [Candidatus Saccharibacteria bacterium]|nr:ATP-dependent Clp protease proteolytic subunit [Candidatus Saccharibacteria bacterium]
MASTNDLPATISINSTIEEIERINARTMRRLYLYGEITSVDEDEVGFLNSSIVSQLIDDILDCNRMDKDIEPEEREPVYLYINSPGGNMTEGFALISMMELSKTPIYTINVGEWSSMSFLIGITGKKRLSLPNTTFLLHDGFSIAGGTTNKVQDRVDFEKKFENDVIKKHILKHSKMKGIDYDALKRVELYMLPEDALERGFIDEIVTDIDTIL